MKVYFFDKAVAEMMLFVKPASGKTHIYYWNRGTALCGKPVRGGMRHEAPQSELCARCLLSLRPTHCFSYREVEESVPQVSERSKKL
jgi:hypothetical protein